MRIRVSVSLILAKRHFKTSNTGDENTLTPCRLLIIILFSCNFSGFISDASMEFIIKFFENTNNHQIYYKVVFVFSDQLLMEDVELKKQMCCTTVNWSENLKMSK